MKVFIALGFICFMGVSVYLLLNEKKILNKPHTVALVKPAKPKNIPPYMLQRERGGKVSIFTFESNDTGVKYKINEEQLDEFANQVKSLKENQPAEK